MKAMSLVLKAICVIVLTVFCSVFVEAQQTQTGKRIGIFDSRAVAIAYARSEQFTKQLGEMRAELKKAKEEGDEDKVKELNKQGPHLQQLLHLQGFSTGSICNIIERIKDKFPQIADENHVDLIISKWEIAYLAESCEIVDITKRLVNLFNPNEQTLTVLEQMKNQPPVPIEELIWGPEN